VHTFQEGGSETSKRSWRCVRVSSYENRSLTSLRGEPASVLRDTLDDVKELLPHHGRLASRPVGTTAEVSWELGVVSRCGETRACFAKHHMVSELTIFLKLLLI
jgi:hypothetical protein